MESFKRRTMGKRNFFPSLNSRRVKENFGGRVGHAYRLFRPFERKYVNAARFVLSLHRAVRRQ